MHDEHRHEEHHPLAFKFEITSFEDFVRFCALIRGEDIEDLRAMTQRLKTGNTELAKVIAENQP